LTEVRNPSLLASDNASVALRMVDVIANSREIGASSSTTSRPSSDCNLILDLARYPARARTILRGHDIDTTLADVNAWSHRTQNFGGTGVLSGGHFFLHAHGDRILQEIACQLHPSRRNYVSDRCSIRTSAAPLTFIVIVAEVVGG
jgi:hypothetical protein